MKIAVAPLGEQTGALPEAPARRALALICSPDTRRGASLRPRPGHRGGPQELSQGTFDGLEHRAYLVGVRDFDADLKMPLAPRLRPPLAAAACRARHHGRRCRNS